MSNSFPGRQVLIFLAHSLNGGGEGGRSPRELFGQVMDDSDPRAWWGLQLWAVGGQQFLLTVTKVGCN